MGEYANYQGSRIKIGTCESMYYLRADQASLVTALDGNVHPRRDAESIRFRFPFPSEDHIKPGDFEYPLPEIMVSYPSDLPASHGTINVQQGTGSRRVSAALPCPMVAPEIWHQYVRAYSPHVLISYQGQRNGHLAVIVSCAYCDGMWNLSERADAEAFVVSIRSEADELKRLGESRREDAAELHKIADRILAGYATEHPVVGDE